MIRSIEYDYTFKRLGARTEPHGNKVVLCPVCGRRGVLESCIPGVGGRLSARMYVHGGRLEVGGPFAMFVVGERCDVGAEGPLIESQAWIYNSRRERAAKEKHDGNRN